MLAQKSGHIVTVTSMDGKIGLPPDAPYVSAKFALTGFCEVLRQEVSDQGNAVTNVLPGRVDTVMIEHLRFSWVSPRSRRRVLRAPSSTPFASESPLSSCHPRQLYYINVFAPRLSDRLSRFFRLEGWTTNQAPPKSTELPVPRQANNLLHKLIPLGLRHFSDTSHGDRKKR